MREWFQVFVRDFIFPYCASETLKAGGPHSGRRLAATKVTAASLAGIADRRGYGPIRNLAVPSKTWY